METTATSVASAELTPQILEMLERAAQPLTLSQIQRGLPRTYHERSEEVRQGLQELASQGRIYQFAPYRSKEPRFWMREPREFAQLVIVELLTEQALTQRELMLKIRKRLQAVPEDELRQLLAQMLVEGQVRKMPPRMGGRSNLLSARPPQPGDYMKPVFEALLDTLGEVYKRLETEGVSREAFLQEAETLWRAMPWDRLGEARPPRRRAGKADTTDSTTPFEPAAAATESPTEETAAESHDGQQQEAMPRP